MISLNNFVFSNKNPFVLIGGINVIESEEMALDAANIYSQICNKYKIPLVFKASFDKANRSSINSFRGPGLQRGLEILSNVKSKFNIPVLTDIHEKEQASLASKVCDILQLPAFLARQTDLIEQMALTDSIINIKKPQFLSPYQMKNIIEKFKYFGNEKLILCERGTCFGYDNLVVDILGISQMKKELANIPLIFDVTHSLQVRTKNSEASGGRSEFIFELARAGVATGIAGIFLEAHREPKFAKCDGPSALKLSDLDNFLFQMKEIDKLVKSYDN